jgi:hypothetical protein
MNKQNESLLLRRVLHCYRIRSNASKKNHFCYLGYYTVIRLDQTPAKRMTSLHIIYEVVWKENEIAYWNEMNKQNDWFYFGPICEQTHRMRSRYKIFCIDSVESIMVLPIDAVCIGQLPRLPLCNGNSWMLRRGISKRIDLTSFYIWSWMYREGPSWVEVSEWRYFIVDMSTGECQWFHVLHIYEAFVVVKIHICLYMYRGTWLVMERKIEMCKWREIEMNTSVNFIISKLLVNKRHVLTLGYPISYTLYSDRHE